MGRKITGRVNIPRIPVHIIELSRKILKKHEEDGDQSPLLQIDGDLKMSEMNALIAIADEQHDEAQRLHAAAELATKLRNDALKKLLAKQRRAGGFLKNLHSDNPHLLWRWGYEVDSSPQRKKKKGAEEGE